MSDGDIAKAVAPFWRCPDWCNRGANYRAELDALRARVAELEQSVHDLCLERGALTMERDRLREALEDAPTFHTNSREQDAFEFKYPHWYDTTRREALDG
jgi:regulator of replication initiation timing